MGSQGFEPGPLSSYEGALVDFHQRIRAVCPVVDSDAAPPPGTVRARNEELLAARRRS